MATHKKRVERTGEEHAERERRENACAGDRLRRLSCVFMRTTLHCMLRFFRRRQLPSLGLVSPASMSSIPGGHLHVAFGEHIRSNFWANFQSNHSPAKLYSHNSQNVEFLFAAPRRTMAAAPSLPTLPHELEEDVLSTLEAQFDAGSILTCSLLSQSWRAGCRDRARWRSHVHVESKSWPPPVTIPRQVHLCLFHTRFHRFQHPRRTLAVQDRSPPGSLKTTQ